MSIALTLMTISSAPVVAHAAPVAVSISVGDRLSRIDRLRPSVRRYLRYKVENGKRSTVDIWERRVALTRVDGSLRLHMSQRWDGVADLKYVRLQDSWFEPRTLRPLTHVSTVDRDGKRTVAGYSYAGNRIVGTPDLPDNTRRDFVQSGDEPAYNFEYDLELFQVLPWRPRYEVSLPFYDPGLEPPRRYVFKVAGSQRIEVADGRRIDAWMVTGDYGTGTIVKTFWFAKDTQVLLREESVVGPVRYVKMLLGSDGGDAG